MNDPSLVTSGFSQQDTAVLPESAQKFLIPQAGYQV